MAFPIGHIATGLGFSMLYRRTFDPFKNKALTVKIAGLSLLPDLDYLLTWPLGLSYDIYHRGFSHSLLFAVVMGFAFAVLERRKEPKCILQCSALYIGVILSHDLLDLATTDARFPFIPGLMLAWPWSVTRFALSASPLTDVYIHGGSITHMTPLYFLWHCTRNSLIEAAVFVPPILLIGRIRAYVTRKQALGFAETK